LRLLRSFRYAVQGAAHQLQSEPNAIIQLALAIAAVMLGVWLTLSAVEWVAVVLAIALVMALEAMNTAVEVLADCVTSQRDPQIKIVKDVAAAAVLFAAIGASITGVIVFVPKLLCRMTGTVGE
jgi:diacylglycerol kinase